MTNTLSIATSLPKCGGKFKRAAKAMHITPEALAAIAATVGRLPPETGGMLFGPTKVEGVTDFVYDANGSQRATTVAYSPDFRACTEEQNRQLDANPGRVLDGFVHSHPGGQFPSRESGPAQGDMGFARAALAMNDHMTRFLMPIVTQTNSPTPLLTPWVVEADDPSVPAFANVVICPQDAFPIRDFPEALLEKHGELMPTIPMLVALDLEQLGERIGAPVAVANRTLSLSDGDLQVEVYLPDQFPMAPPLVTVYSAAAIQFFAVPWKVRSAECVELRLAAVFARAKLCAVEV